MENSHHLFQIGTEADPFLQRASITLHGHLRSLELPLIGAKVLAVREGTLDLHGRPVGDTWHCLAETANAGATSIKMKVPVDWRVGDEVVLATTGDRHSQKENEKRTISGQVYLQGHRKIGPR